MEFNDSTVRNFNFEKLKEECFGGSGGNEDSWGASSGFGGSYGKSAYMLIYERKKKKPVKILVDPEEAKAQAADTSIQYDEKKEEYYRLVDYKTGVEEIAPSKIYRQVFEDN
jgi:transposase